MPPLPGVPSCRIRRPRAIARGATARIVAWEEGRPPSVELPAYSPKWAPRRTGGGQCHGAQASSGVRRRQRRPLLRRGRPCRCRSGSTNDGQIKGEQAPPSRGGAALRARALQRQPSRPVRTPLSVAGDSPQENEETKVFIELLSSHDIFWRELLLHVLSNAHSSHSFSPPGPHCRRSERVSRAWGLYIMSARAGGRKRKASPVDEPSAPSTTRGTRRAATPRKSTTRKTR